MERREADSPSANHGMTEAQVALYRSLTPGEKLLIALEKNASADALAEAGIRRRHPGAGDEEVRMRLASLKIDRERMIEVFGWDPDVHGR